MDVLSRWHGPPRVVASGKILRSNPNVWVLEATRSDKENMAVLWANDGKWSYLGLGFE
jgi:hypothetical protein